MSSISSGSIWNRDEWPPPPLETSLVALARRRAETMPHREVYHLLDDDFFETGKLSGPSLTYEELDRQARAIAVSLRRHIGLGERVLLLYAPGLEFMPAFFGCLYAGVIPVPAYPPQAGFQLDPLRSLRGIAGDCRPSAAMTGGSIAKNVQQMCDAESLLAELFWLTNESIDHELADEWQDPGVSADSIALLQYTSGSTGQPRGVMVSEANIMANEYMLQLAFNHLTDRRPGVGVCWLPFHHDMGLIGNVIQSLFVDGPCYFMSPLQLLRKPVRWLQAITHLGPQSSGGPNFAYDLCVQRVTDAEKESLDLSRWELACIGAEAVSPETIERFTEAFAPCGFQPQAFYPSYGLAEATLFVTGGDYGTTPVLRSFLESDGRMLPADNRQRLTLHPKGPSPNATESDDRPDPRSPRTLVGCGWPWNGQELVIANPESHEECARGRIGEVWVRGPCVAQGYWDKPDDTEQTFHATLAGTDRGPFLRTGDLGFLHDGELFLTGRLKDLIIIRGRNYAPEDIEATVRESHEAFRPNSGAAFGHRIDGEEQLVVLQEIDRGNRQIDIEQLAQDIRQRIAEEHQLRLADIVFIKNGTIPKTTSGKIRRFACRQMYESDRLSRWKGRSRS